MADGTAIVENGVNHANAIKEKDKTAKKASCCGYLRANLLTLLTIVGVFAGVALGLILRATRDDPWTQREIAYVSFFGDVFLRMLKGLILPLIISSLIAAIGSLDLSLSGKIGGRAIVYYLVTTICAVILGIILVTTIRPGDGGSVESTGKTETRNVTTVDTLLDLVRNMFAPNLIQACIEQYRTILIPNANESNINKWDMSSDYESGTNILGLVVFSAFLGIALGKMGGEGEPLLRVFQSLSQSMMIITNWVIWVSPLGVMFLISAKLLEIDDFGEVMEQLGMYFATVLVGLLLHGFVILPLLYFVITRKSPITYVINMGQAIATAFGTASSITATAASIGAAGIPQAGLVTMVMVLDTVGLPAEDVSMIIAVDWLLCSHSELPRVLDGLKSLGQYLQHPIDELILENNNIPSLPGRAFIPLKVMRLMLRNNGLERVSSDWLAGLEASLMELFIVEPSLRSFPEDSLDQMISLEAITIQTQLMKRLPKFSGLPKLRHLQIESASLVELSARHFRLLPALEKFHVSGSPRLIRLENGLLQDLPRLSLVNISYCGISFIHPRALFRLPVLTELILIGNKISDAGMVGRGTRELPALSVLRMDFNNLDRLAEASFVDLPSLKNLYLSNNRILELDRGAFHRVPMLRTLDLNHNIIRRIHPESFFQHSATRLEQLWIVDNDIGHISELRALLDALPRLVFLDMSNNHVQDIPFGALRGHPTLERLHLDHNKIHMVEREAFSGMPALRELRLRNNSLSNLLHAPLWNLPALKGLDLSQNYYRRIEPRLLGNLPSLRRIDLSENLVTIVDPATFLETPALEHVNFSHNALVSLHPASFRHLMNLYELDVSSNKLVEFVPGLPRGIEYLHMTKNQITTIPVPPSPDLDLPALRMLDLSSNGLQNIPPGALTSLPQLKKLYLNKNVLQQLGDGSFEGLSRLEILSLSENRLMMLHPNTLKEMSELQTLILRGNKIDILKPELLKNLRNLKMLDISQNRLSEIMSGTFDNARILQIINASHNILSELPLTLKGLKHLHTLDLTNNRLRQLNPNTLSTLTSLTELRMSRNLIRELRKGSFESLQFLKALHLDNNELEVVESNSVRALPMLSIIKMNRNRLRDLPDAAFSELPSLQIAELQENRLKHIANNAFYRVSHLLLLNISHNQLPGLEEAGLRSLRSLEVLDVSNNKLARVTSSNFERMEWLVELKMDNNDICGVHGSTFNDMPRLRVLSMRNNKMMSLPEYAVQKLRSNIALLDIDGNPLLCSCNLLWMRAWLQEAGLVGPRCSDGSLLREMRLSRQECMYEQRTTNPVAPGCEAELLSAPPYSTSQVFSQWMDLKEPTTASSKPLIMSMAPSPEESEYFYDEYVDYPYNETGGPDHNNTFNNHLNSKQEFLTSTSSPKKTSSHYIAGDTPVIYAAVNKNKTKTILDTPKGTSPSPSSSGFTFFGVPLPALNLNNLWPGGGRASSDRKADPVRTKNRETSGRGGNLFPPTEPEIQTGGFIPILPGTTGGFRPIPNPANYNYSIERVQINNTVTKRLNTTTVLPSTLLVDVTEDFLSKRGPAATMGHPIPTPTSTPISTTPNSKIIPTYIVNDTKIIDKKEFADSERQSTKTVQQTAIIEIDKEETTDASITDLKNITTISDLDAIVVNTNSSRNRTFMTTTAVEIETGSDNDSFEDFFQDVVENVSVPVVTTYIPITTISLNKQNRTEMAFKEITSTKPETNIFVPGNTTISKETPSTLSTFLIPGGQQPAFRPPIGRSTITKVVSPHISSTASLQAVQEPKEETLSTTLNNQKAKQAFMTNADNSATSQIPPHDRSMSWYFMNYNKTNLQPYVDPAINSLTENSQCQLSASLLSLVTIFVCRYIIFD